VDQLLKKAEQYARKKKWKKAVEAFSRIEEIGQMPVSVYGPSFANVLKENGEEDRAVEIYLKLARHSSDSSKFQKAIVFYKKVLESQPHHQRALFSLSNLHRSLGNFVEARETETKLRQAYQSRGLFYKALELLQKEIDVGELSRAQNMEYLDKKCELLKKTGQWPEWTEALYRFFLNSTAFSLNQELYDQQAIELTWLRKKLSEEHSVVANNPMVLSIQSRFALHENNTHKAWNFALRSIKLDAFSFSSFETLAALYLQSEHLSEAKEIVSYLNRWLHEEDLAFPLIKKDLDWLESQGLKQTDIHAEHLGLHQMVWLEDVPQQSQPDKDDLQVRDDAMTWFTSKIEKDEKRFDPPQEDTGEYRISFDFHQDENTDDFNLSPPEKTNTKIENQSLEDLGSQEEPTSAAENPPLEDSTEDSKSIPDLSLAGLPVVGIQPEKGKETTDASHDWFLENPTSGDPEEIKQALLRDFGLSQFEESFSEVDEKQTPFIEEFFQRALSSTYLEKIDYGIAFFQLGLFKKSYQVFDSLQDPHNEGAQLTKSYLKAKALAAQGLSDYALSEVQDVIDSYHFSELEKQPFIELKEKFQKRSAT
jgi:tetratricopeptide (TPR) repeat protein